jgi:hypothetical protein
MKKYFAFLLVLIFAAACSEEESVDQKSYYGKIQVAVVQLPGTPPLELRADGKKLSDIPVGSTMITAGRPISLSIYNRDDNALVVDTTVTLSRNELKSFKVCYSDEFGIRGWVNSQPVAADTFAVQFMNSLGSYFDTYPKLDLYICRFNFTTYEYEETGIVIKDFSKARLYPTVYKFPMTTPEGNFHFYAGKLKNPETGESIPQSYLDLFSMAGGMGGMSFIFNLQSDANGYVEVQYIEL